MKELQKETVLEQNTTAEDKTDLQQTDTTSSSESFHFQVNLGGMLDVLSNHLYKSPDVFLRELLQNGVDAITLRQKKQPDFQGGAITITVEEHERMIFHDNGAGLNKEEIHRFLAVIGQSSKVEYINGTIPEDYIGRFGIGLLSCFMVSDSIVVHTKSAEEEQAYVWTGFPDGIYTLNPLGQCEEGTSVILTAKAGMEEYFTKEKAEELVRYYGLALPAPIYLTGKAGRLNNLPADFSAVSRSRLLNFGYWLFEEHFLEAIPIQTPHLSGVAYIVPYTTNHSEKGNHRIYLKHMLLTEKSDTLLPNWAFFLRCFLNTNNLRPTASREDFYEDKELAKARKEFEAAVREHLEKLALKDADCLRKIVNKHELAIKAMSVWDDDLFRLFIDYLTFVTSDGHVTGAQLKKAQNAVWISSVPKFQQLKPIFMAQGQMLICTGYTYDTELISKLADLFQLFIKPLYEENMELVLESPSLEDTNEIKYFAEIASSVLRPFGCRVKLRYFQPKDLPVLYSMNQDVQFLRQVQSAKENAKNIFSNALAYLLENAEDNVMEDSFSIMYCNLNNPLIKKLLSTTHNPKLLQSMVQVLYVQALLAGGYSLQGGELKTMNVALLELLKHTNVSDMDRGYAEDIADMEDEWKDVHKGNYGEIYINQYDENESEDEYDNDSEEDDEDDEGGNIGGNGGYWLS
uniref:HSP90 family protein n=1 Tax=Agathobacter sp. TaxID=2021311 RepID=UPI0040570BDD